jgi:predicted glycosyltransferase
MGGGLGHLNRTLCLARLVARHARVTVLTNCSYAAFVAGSSYFQSEFAVCLPDLKDPVGVEIVEINAKEKEEFSASVQGKLLGEEFDYLVVDTFPRGILGELAALLPQLTAGKKIFVARDLNPDYVERYALRQFVPQHYDLVLNPGENHGPLCDLAVATAPWLIKEVEAFGGAHMAAFKDLMAVDSASKLLLVVSSGQDNRVFEELALAARAKFPGIAVRFLSMVPPQILDQAMWVRHWPGIDLVACSVVVVSSAGYNIAAECTALDVPLIALPQERLYDRQHSRIAASAVSAVYDIAGALWAVERQLAAQPLRFREFFNGSRAALKLLGEL